MARWAGRLSGPRDLAFYCAFRRLLFDAIRDQRKLQERWAKGEPHPGFRSMRTFDPSKPVLVHDRLNRMTFEWRPEWQADYEKHGELDEWNVSNWDGLLLDGWRAL